MTQTSNADLIHERLARLEASSESAKHNYKLVEGSIGYSNSVCFECEWCARRVIYLQSKPK